MARPPRRIDHPSGTSWEAFGERYETGAFGAFVRAAMDAGHAYTTLHELSPRFPFRVMGHPFVTIQGREFGYHSGTLRFLKAGGSLERLALRVRLLRAEYECFMTLREVGR